MRRAADLLRLALGSVRHALMSLTFFLFTVIKLKTAVYAYLLNVDNLARD